MSENSPIEWTHHTFNPWWGCTRISPLACANCYADDTAIRYGHTGLWDTPKRRTFGDAHWSEPRKWDRKAAGADERPRVFCASMADVFDKDAPDGARERLWDLIEDTPNLDWLLLTKRIGLAPKMAPRRWTTVAWPTNVWLGISVCNQEEADRDIVKLLAIPAATRFLSCEPLFGPINLKRLQPQGATWLDCLEGREHIGRGVFQTNNRIDWVIAGGESGPKARPMHPAWPRFLRDQCTESGVPFLFKQWGTWSADAPPELQRATLLAADGRHIYVQADGTLLDPLIQSGGLSMYRVGKKRAGRLLDGRTWDEFPSEAA